MPYARGRGRGRGRGAGAASAAPAAEAPPLAASYPSPSGALASPPPAAAAAANTPTLLPQLLPQPLPQPGASAPLPPLSASASPAPPLPAAVSASPAPSSTPPPAASPAPAPGTPASGGGGGATPMTDGAAPSLSIGTGAATAPALTLPAAGLTQLSPARAASIGVGRGAGAPPYIGKKSPATTADKKTGSGRGRGRGGATRGNKTKSAALQREKEKEKEEEEKKEMLEQWDANGRPDPIPAGVRIEAKWLDEQFHDAVVVKSRKIIGPQSYWLYYVHYPEFNKRMDNWVKRENVRLPLILSFHGSAFAVAYPAAIPQHLLPAVLRGETTVAAALAAAGPAAAGASSTGAAAGASDATATAMDTSAGAAPAASSSNATAAAAPAAASASSAAAAGDAATGAAVSFAASDSVVSIPAAGAGAAAAYAVDFGEAKSNAVEGGSGKAAAGAGKGKGGKGKGGKGKGGKGGGTEDSRKRKRSTGRNIHDGDKKINVIKNINTIRLGKYEMDVWYYAPFPAEYNNFDKLYFCEFCLKFYGWDTELDRHLMKCRLRHPPGNEIYRSEEKNVTIAVFEVDGRKEVIYCQNLCYIAKLFLDDKLYDPEDLIYPFDTDPFLFYVLTEVDSRGCHLVGYFSKAKVSEKNFNLACILTLPCHQRKGYGKFLISLSYELSKIEEKSGSPEKPLSDLGLVSYRSYWSQVLMEILKDNKTDISIEQLSARTSITTDDIVDTLKWMKVMRVDSQSAEHVYDMKCTAAVKTLALLEPKPNKKDDPNRIEVRPCIAERLRWTPFILDPKKSKAQH